MKQKNWHFLPIDFKKKFDRVKSNLLSFFSDNQVKKVRSSYWNRISFMGTQWNWTANKLTLKTRVELSEAARGIACEEAHLSPLIFNLDQTGDVLRLSADGFCNCWIIGERRKWREKWRKVGWSHWYHREMLDRVKTCATTSRPERTTIRLHFAKQLPKKFKAIAREWHFATSDTIFTDME